MALPLALGTHADRRRPSWADYRFAVGVRSDYGRCNRRVVPLPDENNYYRFSVDAAQSYRRLVKRVQGVTTVLWDDGASTPIGRWMRLVVDAIGDRLAVYLDSERLLTLVDDSSIPGVR